jgi:hypothetical protein
MTIPFLLENSQVMERGRIIAAGFDGISALKFTLFSYRCRQTAKQVTVGLSHLGDAGKEASLFAVSLVLMDDVGLGGLVKHAEATGEQGGDSVLVSGFDSAVKSVFSGVDLALAGAVHEALLRVGAHVLGSRVKAMRFLVGHLVSPSLRLLWYL